MSALSCLSCLWLPMTQPHVDPLAVPETRENERSYGDTDRTVCNRIRSDSHVEVGVSQYDAALSMLVLPKAYAVSVYCTKMEVF